VSSKIAHTGDIERLQETAHEIIKERRKQPYGKKDLPNAVLHGIDPLTSERTTVSPRHERHCQHGLLQSLAIAASPLQAAISRLQSSLDQKLTNHIDCSAADMWH
jgi:hypothetical protein